MIVSTGVRRLTVSRRLLALCCPAALYYLLRLLTCVVPVAASLTGNAPDENLGFGSWLVVYAVLVGLSVATAYTVLLRSFMTGEHDGARRRGSVLVVVVVGGLDMAGGLAAIVLSGGWGSPFWHAWLSSLVVPCLVLGMRWSLLVAGVYMIVLSGVLSVTGDGVGGVWLDTHRYLYVGSMITLVLLSAVVGYLGDVCFELQRSRRRSEDALAGLCTMLEIARLVAVITTRENEVMVRVARTIGERHRFDSVGIYVLGADGRGVRLSGWSGEREELERYPRQPDDLVHRAMDAMETRSERDGGTWRTAIPIRDDGTPLGVLLLASGRPAGDAWGVAGLGAMLVSQIAVGIRVAELLGRADAAMSGREWEALTGRIHDRITDSLYSLVLHIEAYSTLAERDANPLAGRLGTLVPHGRHVLFDTREYLYRLLPVLRGEGGLDAVVRSLAVDFERFSGIGVRMSVTGTGTRLPPSSIVACYDIIQNRLADVFHDAMASEVVLELEMNDEGLRLTMADDGVVGEERAGVSGERMEMIRRLVGDVGGDLQVERSPGPGTRIVLGLPVENGIPLGSPGHRLP